MIKGNNIVSILVVKKILKKTFLIIFYMCILPLALYEAYYQFGEYKRTQALKQVVSSGNPNSTAPASTTTLRHVDRGYYWNYPYNERFITFNEDGEEILINTDTLGFRNDGVPKEVDILLLGDSYTSAVNTKSELTFAHHLRQSGWTVYNAGIEGTGTLHQAHILQDVLKEVKPKLVVLNFYLGNDFRDNFYCKDIDAVVKDTCISSTSISHSPSSMPKSLPVPVPLLLSISLKTKLNNLVHHSGVLKLMYNLVYLPLKYEGTDMSYYDRGEMMIMAHSQQAASASHPDVVKALDKTQDALAYIKKLLDEQNIPLVVVGIPSKAQVMRSVREISNFDSDKKGAAFFSTVKKELDFDRPDQILKDLCIKNNLTYISLLRPFRLQQSQKQLFYHFDVHWNYSGQEIAANEVIPQLKNIFSQSNLINLNHTQTSRTQELESQASRSQVSQSPQGLYVK